MAFSLRATANNRWEVKDDSRKDGLMALAFGRKNAEVIVEALNARFGAGDQLDLFSEEAA